MPHPCSSPSSHDAYVGPIVRVPDAELPWCTELSQYRGPFSNTNTSDCLQSSPHAELHILSHHRNIVLSELDEADEAAAARRLDVAERPLRKALELCTIFPGNNQPAGLTNTPTPPSSLRLGDLALRWTHKDYVKSFGRSWKAGSSLCCASMENHSDILENGCHFEQLLGL